ncbi:restriction endonuclease [Pseudomonas borbori]|uniref:Restriction endonuclease n=1 Tax=Pseudomonas borbori TaxID=289003 RepID=A0A1I5MPI3_9PSED|nr:restriction endonuclease [Pseudomonas borbori]SFP11469.1 Restriction endonuclease [Pseudomonas borbori]
MAAADTEYEKLAKEVYDEILQAEGFDTIEVKHNTNIEGKSGQKHQIDVFWEFSIAGMTHRVAVECKNYTSPVSVGKIRDFSAALDDIGNIQGIFITKTGYQAGAKKFANYKGIELKHLREPTEADLKSFGPPPSLNIRGNIYYLSNIIPDIKFNFPWVIQNTQMKEGDPFEMAALNCDIKIVDENGLTLKTFHDLEKELPSEFKEEFGKHHIFKFTNEYLAWPNAHYEKLKLEHIAFQYDVLHTKTFTTFEGRWAAKAVLEDIKSGAIHLHKKEGYLGVIA